MSVRLNKHEYFTSIKLFLERLSSVLFSLVIWNDKLYYEHFKKIGIHTT